MSSHAFSPLSLSQVKGASSSQSSPADVEVTLLIKGGDCRVKDAGVQTSGSTNIRTRGLDASTKDHDVPAKDPTIHLPTVPPVKAPPTLLLTAASTPDSLVTASSHWQIKASKSEDRCPVDFCV